MTLYQVNASRLLGWIAELRQIGTNDALGPGIHRPALSPADLEGRAWFRAKIKEHNLVEHIDAAGNIHARLPSWSFGPKPTPSTPAVCTGSHLDTVRGGGHLDGTLGVLAGLEVLVRIQELGLQPSLLHPIEVINFTDEEGRFGGMFGSQALTGQVSAQQLRQRVSVDGTSAAQALNALLGEGADASVHEAAYERGSVHAFVKLHIEQGPVLDTHGDRLGAVTGIVGLWKAEWTLSGQANHAGTTPMDLRKDAFLGCAHVLPPDTYTHMHTHIHTNTHTYAHKHTYKQRLKRIELVLYTKSRAHTPSHTHSHSHSNRHTLPSTNLRCELA